MLKLKISVTNITSLAVLIVMIGVLHLLGANYWLHILTLVGIYVLLALGLNIVIGYTGHLDLGFMAFYAIGAYTSALLSIHGFSFWMCLPISVFVTMLFRYLLVKPVLGLRGDYLAVVTLGFGEITRLLLNNLDPLTNGPKGLPGVGQQISSIKFFHFELQQEYQFCYLVFFFVLLAIWPILAIEKSKYGRSFVAIRENEIAAEVAGVNIQSLKMMAFLLSSVMAAIAGTIYVHWIGFVSPESFTFWESIFLVAMIVLGGIGNIAGIILGTFLLVGAPEVLRSVLGNELILYRMLIFGIVMVLMVIFRPQGMIPEKRHAWEFEERTDAAN